MHLREQMYSEDRAIIAPPSVSFFFFLRCSFFLFESTAASALINATLSILTAI